jgi:hypothetical protein
MFHVNEIHVWMMKQGKGFYLEFDYMSHLSTGNPERVKICDFASF